MWQWDLALYGDGFSSRPKHAGSYCKQKGICLPVKLCQLSEKYILFHIIKYSVMPHTKLSPALLFPEGLNKAQGMEQDTYKAKHNYQKETIVSQFIFQIQMVPNDIQFHSNQPTNIANIFHILYFIRYQVGFFTVIFIHSNNNQKNQQILKINTTSTPLFIKNLAAQHESCTKHCSLTEIWHYCRKNKYFLH